MKSIAVYCGASPGASPEYAEAARALARVLVDHDIGLVFGGGKVGLMGVIADAVLAHGGRAVGVIPRQLMEREVGHTGLTQLHVVADMHQRKAAFTRLSDGFLTIPGGVGTMDELWEAVSWAQLGYHAKPVGLLNAFGFYDHLIAFNQHMIAVGFVRPAHQAIIIAESELDLLLERMAAHQPHTPIFAMKTSDL